MPTNMQLQKLATAIRRQVPRESGVYLFRDRSGAPLYIGKSVNLRQRMLSYFGSDPTRLETRIRQMAFSVRSFEFRDGIRADGTLVRERPHQAGEARIQRPAAGI